MEFTDILTAISTVGFPIVACIAMFWLMNRNNDTIKDLTVTLEGIRANMDSMKDEIARMGQAIWGKEVGK